MKSKLVTYLGFCVRARKIAFGVDEVEKQGKSVFLLLMDEELGQSSQKIMIKAKEKFACPLLVVDKGVLGETLYRLGVKAAAIKDKQLALAILSVVESEPQFKFYSGGTN